MKNTIKALALCVIIFSIFFGAYKFGHQSGYSLGFATGYRIGMINVNAEQERFIIENCLFEKEK